MKKQKVALIGLNPNKVHSSGIYYLKAYAEKMKESENPIILTLRFLIH